MIKKLLSYIFFILTLAVQGQEAGILIKTTLFPNQGWNGSHGGRHSITIGSKSIFKSSNTESTVKIVYDFFYVTDNPSVIECMAGIAGNRDEIKCNLEKDIPYNKFKFQKGYFDGCIADSEIMGIYILPPDPDKTNETCASEDLTLTGGWNWQYKLDNGSWKPFPNQYQEKSSITFKVKDLEGYTNQQNIHFQAGYQTNFTNISSYKIIGCSPKLAIDPPNKTDVQCFGNATGSVTLNFTTEKELKNGDKFLFTIYLQNENGFQFDKHVFAAKNEIINNSYTWANLPAGTYMIKYQTQSVTDDSVNLGESVITTKPFIIGTSPKFTYQVKLIQPPCNNDNGTMIITPSGGTSPYYYKIDNETNWHMFTDSVTIPDITEGEHNIKVIDKYNCIEKKITP